jgi:lactate 2-monooxygenase
LIFVHGLGHKVSRVPVHFSALEERARRVMTKRGFAYVAGGAGNERTMVANRAAFDRWRIVPRMLCDVSRRDLSLTLFGERLPTPLILAPIGVMEMVHARADLAAAGQPRQSESRLSFPTRLPCPWKRALLRWVTEYGGSSSIGVQTTG